MILNLTQHQATPEQIAQGVVEPHKKVLIKDLLTFTSAPSTEEVWVKARTLAALAEEAGADSAMIGGAPYLMGKLEFSLKQRGIKPLYSFTERVSEEVHQPDGTVTKTNVFKHVGWVEGGVA